MIRWRAVVARCAGSLSLAVLAVSVAVAPPAVAATSRSLEVFAAASLAGPFTEIGRMLERQQPGLVVRCNFAGSQQLAAQLAQGASADVFASADERWMEYVRERSLLAGDVALFARNRLVAIVPRTNPARLRRLQDLARPGIKLVLAADAVPVGRYSRTVLRNLSADQVFGSGFATAVLRNVVSEEESVKGVVGKVQLGEADAGIVYRSDVTPGLVRFVTVLEIPAGANVLASYPIAVGAHAKSPVAARAFVDLALSPAGQRVLERWGFMPATATVR